MKRESASESYLRRATRGLWGRKRLEVKEELAAHLAIRMQAHRVAGLSKTEAEERALAELGSPQRVSAGMTRLYTLPTVLGSSLAMVAVCVAVVGLWPKGLAQTLDGTFYWPSPECMAAVAQNKLGVERNTCIYTADQFWISQKELQSVLEPQGVVFKKVLGPAAELLSVAVPGTTPVFVPVSSSETSVEAIYTDGETFTKAPGYLSLWEFVESFSLNQDARLEVSGWANPTVQLNDVSLQLRDGNRSITESEFYESYLSAVFYQELASDLWQDYGSISYVWPDDLVNSSPSKTAKSASTLTQASLGVSGNSGDVYGVITYLDPQSQFANQLPKNADYKEATFWIQLRKVTEQGDIRVRLPQGVTTFVETFGYGEDLKPGNSILVRLAGGKPSGGGWYEIVSPQEITRPPR